jgi:hypothetical protein
MQELRPYEEWARRVMQQELGVEIRQYDDGSQPSMYDLDVLRVGVTAAAEIAAAVDSTATETWNVLNSAGRWIEPAIAGGWGVLIRPEAHGLRRSLPPFLHALETAGIRELRGRAQGSTFEAMAERMGIVRATQSATTYPGSIYPTLRLPQEQIAGYGDPDGDALPQWLHDFLWHEERKDVREKLSRSGAEERHAFIVVSPLSGAPFEIVNLLLLDDAPSPTIRPDLPHEITDAWVVSTWDSGVGFRWTSDGAWLSFSKQLA